jgi:diguanylate cyclase (GGDEF)-like protein
MIGSLIELLRGWVVGLRATAPLTIVLASVLWAVSSPAHALQPIMVTPDQERLEITTLGEYFDGRGDSLQVETAPGVDGITGRMSVRATTQGTSPSWIVFALRNTSDKQVERWVTAERYSVIGSGVVWPDLDARRLEALTPSIGFVPERVKSDRADIFRITLEPGQTITYVAELSSERFARIYLWKPLEYELKARDRQLFNGINLGLVGLLAIFLTAVFAANHKVIFPAAALVAWCVLAYLCVDFGFWHKLFQLRPEDNAVYRAATEASIAASLVIFLYTFLRLGLWHGFLRVLVVAWIAAQLALIAVAAVDPRLASTFARASFPAIGGIGFCFMLYLALRGQDRALSLVPTWMLFLVWCFGAGVVVTGRLAGDVVVSGLVAGLVLIVVLLGFTVTQFAFRALEPLYGASPSDVQLRSLAVDGAGAAIWEWNTRRDEFKISPQVEMALGLPAGALSTTVEDFTKHVHSADRERFRLTLWSVQERNGGAIQLDFRMRHTDNSYRWFEIEAASLPATDRRALRCVGLMRDVTDSKRAHERLLHDAVHDSLTGLPNRELFLDRLNVAAQRAVSEPSIRPTVIFIDMDKFRGINSSLGLIVGDSLLLTIARRLARHLGPLDTLARIGGDQFAILLTAEQDPRELAALAERIRRSLRSPIKISEQEIVLTGSLGIAVYDGVEGHSVNLMRDAEIAMYRAKRGGTDRIEIFQPDMVADREDRKLIEADLLKAIEKSQVRVLYQPIIYLPTEELAGFEAVLHWEHPKIGTTNPASLEAIEEAGETAVKLGSYLLARATHDVARWQKELPRADSPVFVSVGISSRHLFRQDLIQEVRHIFGRQLIPKGTLKLEVNEALIMENPEQAAEILEWLRGAGAELSLDDFGTGYSSVAYLQRFAFDTVKLDRGLVQSAQPGGEGAAMVRSIVALAHELGKKIVAEGIETSEDVAFLRSIGCEYAEGSYYSEPMGEREVLALLRAVRKSERKLQRRGFLRAKSKEKAQERKASRPRETKPAAIAAKGTAPAELVGQAAAAVQAVDGESAVARSETPPRRRTGLRNGHLRQVAVSEQVPPPHGNGNDPVVSSEPRPSDGRVNGHDPQQSWSEPAVPGSPSHSNHTYYPQSQPPPPPMPMHDPDYARHHNGYATPPASAPEGESNQAMSTLAAALAADQGEGSHEPAAHDISPAHLAGQPMIAPEQLRSEARPTGDPAPAFGYGPAQDEGAVANGGIPPHMPPELEPDAPLGSFSAALPSEPPRFEPIEPPPAPAMPELKTLPPAIAASLARLAGLPQPAPPSPPPQRQRVASGEER